MGWSYGYNNRCAKDVHREILDPAFWGDSLKVVRHAATSYGRHLWLVCEKPDGARFIALFLINGNDGGWGYKDMTEDMGPCYYDCPLAFLDMVPEANARWREKVRAHHAARARVYLPGDAVTVYGKPYTVVSKVKRSYLIRSPEGTVYRAGPARMMPA